METTYSGKPNVWRIENVTLSRAETGASAEDRLASTALCRHIWNAPFLDSNFDITNVMTDSVLPIIEADLHTLVEMDHHLTSEVSLMSTPGHTPGHVSVSIHSNGIVMQQKRLARFDIIFSDKKSNGAGLQIADLMAHPIGRHVINPKQENRSYNIVEKKFHKYPYHEGKGLKIFPK